MRAIIILGLAGSLLLGACGPTEAEPTQTILATMVLTQSAEAAQASPEDLVNMAGEGAADEEWEGIPIMPGALHGEAQGKQGYTFTVEAPADEIRAFYVSELEAQGAELMLAGERQDENGLFLPFSRGGRDVVSISVTAAEGVSVVRILQ